MTLHGWSVQRHKKSQSPLFFVNLWSKLSIGKWSSLPPALVSTALSGFSVPGAVRISRLGDGLSILELFHGSTMAFKDLAMTCTVHFTNYFLQKEKRRAIVLVGKTEVLGFCTLLWMDPKLWACFYSFIEVEKFRKKYIWVWFDFCFLLLFLKCKSLKVSNSNVLG